MTGINDYYYDGDDDDDDICSCLSLARRPNILTRPNTKTRPDPWVDPTRIQLTVAPPTLQTCLYLVRDQSTFG